MATKRKGIRPQSAKAKGRKWQQNVAAYLTEKFDLDEGDIVSRPMGSGGADLMMSPAAKRVFPITVECKKTATDPGRSAMKQAQHNALKGTIGAVVWQTTGEGGTKGEIRFDLEEFVSWFKGVYAHQARVNNTCGRCLGHGTIGEEQQDEYGSTYVQVPCPECKGTRKRVDNAKTES